MNEDQLEELQDLLEGIKESAGLIRDYQGEVDSYEFDVLLDKSNEALTIVNKVLDDEA